jgi:hypothetical protein
MKETLPAAYRLDDESVWDRDDVSEMYPELVDYWKSKGATDIVVMPCGPVDEDVLYIHGKFQGYCRMPFEWKLREDLTQDERPPKAKQRRTK